ncbi:MAG: hypothetical protein R3B98_05135 [Hyphomonas sp.]
MNAHFYFQMSPHRSTPAGWLSERQARAQISGELGNAYRHYLSRSCAPIYWFSRKGRPNFNSMRSGTVTIVETPDRLLGITAAHVIAQLLEDEEAEKQTVLIMNSQLTTIDVIDIDDRLDIATFGIDENTIETIGKAVTPLTYWPPQPPLEGRGILLAGYPGISRQSKYVSANKGAIEWGLFTAIGISGRVTDDQILWRVARENTVPHPTIPDLPLNAELGGISGGPVISLMERGGVHFCVLSGIVSEASAQLELVVAKRADFIQANGKIDRRLA